MKNFTYKYIIIDSNNWYYRNYEVYKDMTYQVKEKTIITGGIYGFLKSMKLWIKNFSSKDTVFYFLFDNAKSKDNLRRNVIDPEYKLNRDKKPKSFYRSLDYLRLILSYYDDRFFTVYGTGYEADDIVPYILNTLYIDDNNRCLLISEDMDWSRLINKNIDVFMKKDIYTKYKFTNRYGFPPDNDKVTLYKVIRGDSSDNISPGVPYLPEKDVIYLVSNFKDIYEVLENLEITHLNEKWKKAFRDNKSRLNLNHQLISFFPIDENSLDEYISKSSYDYIMLSNLYDCFGFDIEEIDKRTYSHIVRKEQKEKGYIDNFFKPPKVRR